MLEMQEHRYIYEVGEPLHRRPRISRSSRRLRVDARTEA